MKNHKLALILLLFSGLGCPLLTREDRCEVHEDCPRRRPVCSEGLCINTQGEGEGEGDCTGIIDATTVCLENGSQVPRCEENVDCASGQLCNESVALPELFNQCVPVLSQLGDACVDVAMTTSGRRDEDGPFLWNPVLVLTQTGGCRQEDFFGRGYSVTLFYYDAEGDGPSAATDEFQMVMEFDAGYGSWNFDYNAGEVVIDGDGSAGSIHFNVCVNQVPLPAAVGLQLIDNNGHRSDLLCMTIDP